MLIALDAAYDDAANRALAAGVLFQAWSDAEPARIVAAGFAPLAPYEPGAFYKRELPCLLRVLEQVGEPLEAVVVDGYVWLDGRGRPGLGAHLHAAIGGVVPVIGVAKTRFRGDSWSAPVLRGRSLRPLFLTVAGMPVEDAVLALRQMHGVHRVPTLLRLADAATRGRA